MFDGLQMGLHNIALLSDAETRSISAENPNGERGGGAKASTCGWQRGFAARSGLESAALHQIAAAEHDDAR